MTPVSAKVSHSNKAKANKKNDLIIDLYGSSVEIPGFVCQKIDECLEGFSLPVKKTNGKVKTKQLFSEESLLSQKKSVLFEYPAGPDTDQTLSYLANFCQVVSGSIIYGQKKSGGNKVYAHEIFE